MMDKQTERILNIIGVDSEADAIVTGENLQKYLEFLKENIEMPCMLTGIEDFSWEEYYVLGPGSEKEYNKVLHNLPCLLGFPAAYSRKSLLYLGDEQRAGILKISFNSKHKPSHR